MNNKIVLDQQNTKHNNHNIPALSFERGQSVENVISLRNALDRDANQPIEYPDRNQFSLTDRKAEKPNRAPVFAEDASHKSLTSREYRNIEGA